VWNNKYHARSKHIDIHYHFIHQVLERNDIDITYVPIKQNIANIFTKALPTSKFNHFQNLLGLCFAWGGVLEKQARLSPLIFPFMVICGFHHLLMIFCYATSSSTWSWGSEYIY
jgi:hypothetical protein